MRTEWCPGHVLHTGNCHNTESVCVEVVRVQETKSEIAKARKEEQGRICEILKSEISTPGISGIQMLRIIDRIMLPPIGTSLAGGSQIGYDIFLPNGGTWRRVQ